MTKFARDAKISLTYVLMAETEKAANFGDGWLPKSQITIERIPGAFIDTKTKAARPLCLVTIPVWLIRSRDMASDAFIAKQLENPMTLQRAIDAWNEVNVEKIGKAA